jgi:hypothetical protein
LAKMFSPHIGKIILAVTSDSTGYVGRLVAISLSPAILHLEEAEIVTLRATIIDPIPRITSREPVEGGEVLLNINHIHKIQLVAKGPPKQKGTG